MPDLLHGLPAGEKEQTVEALVHFLVSLQENGTEQGTSAEDFLIRQGRTLYHTIGCVACHEPQASPNSVPAISPDDPKLEQYDPSLKPPASVPLGDLARKTTVEQLTKFLMDPLKVRPSGRMPSFDLSGSEATSIAVYLLRAQAATGKDAQKPAAVAGLKYQYYEETFGSAPDFEAMTPKASGSVNGFDISARKRDNFFGFRFSGSIQIPTNGTYTFFVRSDDGAMLYIDGKLVVDNNGDHAPEEKRGNIPLPAGEHGIVTTYYNNGAGFEFDVQWRGPGFKKQHIPSIALSHLGRPMVPVDQEEFTVDRAKAEKGSELFANLGCGACHNAGETVTASPNRAKPFAELPADERGCLADVPPAGVPQFGFSNEQRKEMQLALARKDSLFQSTGAQQGIAQTLARLNCYACHTRDGKGGASDARLAYFRTAGALDMGDEGRIPPHLTRVGGKLRREWIEEVLLNHGRARPYMATRMPQFGRENVGALPSVFEKADVQPNERQPPEVTQRDAKYGRKLTGVGGLSCIACHMVGGHKSLGIPAIDLASMNRRLRYDWFGRYVIDPPSLRPGTRMPSFWPNGEAVNKDILAGNTTAQINAIWSYLASKPETDLPDGLIQGRMELQATTEPIIYRNFIEGAGSRAIGVGYPEKVNLAFDANNIRLAMIWQGAFIDAARHRSGRGEGYEPPLGNNILKMPPGPEIALLQDNAAAWPSSAGKEGGFKMGGYSLDEKGRPTFFYTFKDIRVEEAFEPVRGEVDAYFKRTLNFSGSPEGQLWFRAAVGKIQVKNSGFALSDNVILNFPGAKPVLRGTADERELLVPVQFSGGKATLVEEIIW